MDGPHWIDLFWTSVIYGWTMICVFQRFLEACILHGVFAEYQQRLKMFLCKTTFAENWFLESCEIWCGDDEDGFAICMAIWNVVYCLRMCMLDNKLQTFFNLVLFQQLCGRELCGDGFVFFTACCMWATGNCVLSGAWCFSNNVCTADFFIWDWDDFSAEIWCFRTVHVNK